MLVNIFIYKETFSIGIIFYDENTNGAWWSEIKTFNEKKIYDEKATNDQDLLNENLYFMSK